MAFRIKLFEVNVSGFPPVNYAAASRGKAIASAWRDYTHAYDVSFKEFLKRASARRAQEPEDFGKPIIVCGQPGYLVTGVYPNPSGYVRFARDDEDYTHFSHPADVEAA
ncbi:hypothetical protein [Roseibium sp. Sym1]|uniref:hypothetical protein n=1 Tax=Roseibium sp. Sym1 TaxID=3016006 RepID=UPI0022B3A208|nr:hypothetical protein [Roseibium sp. Sym1]